MTIAAVKKPVLRRMRDSIRFAACAGLAAALVLAMSAPALRAEDALGGDVRPYVVKIHADWCGTCRMLESTWKQIESELGDRAHLVKLDVSDRAAAEQSLAEAERLGLSEFYLTHRASTGTIGVINGKTFEPVAILLGEPDISKYREAVERARDSS